jgi:hypothetical protein
MVDYNIAIPQQQLYQAPDPMQNFLRMQQMEQMGATSRLRNMQAQNLLTAQQQTAAERAQAAAIEEEASGAVRGGASPTEAAENLTREGKLGAAARISAHGKTLSEGQKAELDIVDNTLKGFGYWSTHVRSPEEAGSLGAGMYNTSRLRPFFDSIGIKSAEQAAQKFSTDFATDENAWRTGLAKLDSPTLFSLRAAKQVALPGGGTGTIDPNKPGVINESVIREAGAPELTPSGGAGAGRVNTYPVSPTRVANMNAAAGRTGNAPIIDDGGLAARADMGVNALAAGQRQQPAVVGNAMAAPPAPASPYGALVQPPAARAPGVVGSREFAQRAADAEMAQAIKKAGLETAEREQAKLNVATPEAARVKAVAKEEFQKNLANMATQIQELGQKGMLVKTGETTFANRAKAGLSDVSPGVTTLVSPERGENVAALANLRLSLLTALMAATGKTSSQINSDFELKKNLDALSSPGQTIKTITDTMNNLSEQYGSGKKYKVEDFTGGVAQNPPSEVPTGRRSTTPAAAPAKPTERPPLSSFGG